VATSLLARRNRRVDRLVVAAEDGEGDDEGDEEGDDGVGVAVVLDVKGRLDEVMVEEDFTSTGRTRGFAKEEAVEEAVADEEAGVADVEVDEEEDDDGSRREEATGEGARRRAPEAGRLLERAAKEDERRVGLGLSAVA
jgi:hypothetical protein